VLHREQTQLRYVLDPYMCQSRKDLAGQTVDLSSERPERWSRQRTRTRPASVCAPPSEYVTISLGGVCASTLEAAGIKTDISNSTRRPKNTHVYIWTEYSRKHVEFCCRGYQAFHFKKCFHIRYPAIDHQPKEPPSRLLQTYPGYVLRTRV